MTHTLSLLAAFSLSIFACESTPSSLAGNLTAPNASAGPPGTELLEALEGLWQSERSDALVLEIRGEKMTRIHENQPPQEFSLEAFSDCGAAPCATDEASGGWCFTEKSANGLLCNRVLRCDSLLQFKVAGKTDVFKFKKVKP